MSTHFQLSENTWDAIAESFDHTRKKPWKQCLDFIEFLDASSLVIDLGCGNGRHLIPCAQHCKMVIGFDISKNLLSIAEKKAQMQHVCNTVFVHGNLIQLPFKNNVYDAVLYIASLHNIKEKEYRLQSLQEVNRILKPKGIAMISVWSRWQQKFRNYFFKKLLSYKKEFGDIEIHWCQHKLDIPRFYHLYSKKEFKDDLRQAGLSIKNIESVHIHSKFSADNYFAIVKKGNCY
jgi:alkylated DNA repair protein alkB family protein 8